MAAVTTRRAWQAVNLDLDIRREIFRMLERLNPLQLIQFEKWCCRQVRGPDGISKVVVTSHTGTVQETYWDILGLEVAHGLDLEKVAEKLVEVVRRL